jgi:hypothetical protein
MSERPRILTDWDEVQHDPLTLPPDDFQGIDIEDAVEKIKDWFFENFEDPVQSTPPPLQTHPSCIGCSVWSQQTAACAAEACCESASEFDPSFLKQFNELPRRSAFGPHAE